MSLKKGDKMEIIKLKTNDITPYEKNAKIHTEAQIEQIKKSIQEFGMNDPIAVWGKSNTIVEGHGRLEALKQLGYTEVDCIRLDHLTDEERKAYTLAHNKINMNTGFDIDLLDEELDSIEDIDMSDFGFEEQNFIDDLFDEEVGKGPQEFSDMFSISFYFDKKYENDIKEVIKEKGKEYFQDLITDVCVKECM